MSLSDKINPCSEHDKSFKRFIEVEDVQEAVRELKLKALECRCEYLSLKNSKCDSCNLLMEIFGDKLI